MDNSGGGGGEDFELEDRGSVDGEEAGKGIVGLFERSSGGFCI